MGKVKFNVGLTKITTDTERAYQIFQNAVEILKGPLPAPSQECEFCAWRAPLQQDLGI